MEGNRVKENDELVQALQKRVSKLEARARRWRLLSVLMVLAGVLLVLVGASRSEIADPTVIRARTVEARDFLLKDEHGRVRARLSVYPKEVTVHGKAFPMPPGKAIPGQAALQFFDENGEEVWAEPKQATLEQIR
jgi:hypothetical protein